MEKMRSGSRPQLREVVYDAAILTLIFLTALPLVSIALSVFDVTVGIASFSLSVMVALLFYGILFRSSKRNLILGFIICAAVILGSVLLVSLFWDRGGDANWYHRFAIGALERGWNPLREPVLDWSLRQPYLPDASKTFLEISMPEFWVSPYPKATWYIGANLYSITGNIEAAKCCTLLAAFSLFGVAQSYFLEKGVFARWQAVVIALVLALNPIAATQLFSSENDGFLILMLFMVILALTILADDNRSVSKGQLATLLFCSIALCVNTKFSGLLYAGAFCLAYFLFICFRAWRGRDQNAVKSIARKTAYILGCFLVAVFIMGATSYVTNIVREGNPLYPAYGPGKVELMDGNEPIEYRFKSDVEKKFISLFSESTPDAPKLKIPGTVRDGEFAALLSTNLKGGGFGVFFGVILLVSIVILVMGAFKLCIRERKYIFFFRVSGLNILVSLMLFFLLEESWWARFSGYLYLVPVSALVTAFLLWNEQKKSPIRLVVMAAFLALIGANVGMILGSQVYYGLEDTKIHNQDELTLKHLSQEGALVVDFDELFAAQAFAFEDEGIPYQIEYGLRKYAEVDPSIKSTYLERIYYRADLGSE